MKRRDVGFVVAASLAAFVAGCFSDPTSDLRNGPATIVLTRNAVTILKGDSIQVVARLVDGQGNLLAISAATWTSGNEAVATLSFPSDVNPGDNVSKAWIKGIPVEGGITYVYISTRGLTDSVRVTVLPNAVLPSGVAAVTGTASADTVAGAAFSAGDTLVLTAPSGFEFNATASVVHLGGVTTYLLSRSATALKVIARGPYRGRPAITKVSFLGDANTGEIVIDSLLADSVNLARARFRGTAAVATGAFGTNSQLTLTAQSGTTFNTSGSTTSVLFGTTAATIVSRTSSAITVITTATGGFTGTVKLTNVNVGTTRVDSLRTPGSFTVAKAALPDANVTVRTGTFGTNTELKVTPPSGTTFSATTSNVVLGATNGTPLFRSADSIVVIATASFTGTVKVTNLTSTGTGGAAIDSLRNITAVTINPSNFPGTVTNGAGRLLDTVKVIGGPNADFTTSGSSASNVTINGLTAFVLRRAADTLYVIAKKPGTATVTITSVIVGSTTISSLTTSGTLAVSTTTGEANELTNNTRSGATAIAFTGAADTITVYGSVDCEDDGTACPGNGDDNDNYTFTLSASANIRAIATWFGDGKGGFGTTGYGTDTNNPDLDVVICTSAGTSCSYGSDIAGNSGAGLSQPETASSSSAQAAGTYYVRVFSYVTPSPITYQLRVLRF